MAQTVKSLPTNAGDTTGAGSIPGFGRSLEDGIETHSSIFDGESHGQRSLEGYSPWSRKESDTIEHTQHRCIFTLKKKKKWTSLKKKEERYLEKRKRHAHSPGRTTRHVLEGLQEGSLQRRGPAGPLDKVMVTLYTDQDGDRLEGTSFPTIASGAGSL